MDYFDLGLNQRNQVPQKIQHLNPAAMPLWRSLRLVLAAILVGPALRDLENCNYFPVTIRLVQDWGRVFPVHCPKSRPGCHRALI